MIAHRTGLLIGEHASRACPGSARSTRSVSKILRRHAELIGLKSNFSILDTDDQLRLLKQVIDAARIDDKRWPARHLSSQWIDSWKNRAPDAQAHVPAGESRRLRRTAKAPKLYDAYQAARLKDTERRRLRRPSARRPSG